MLARFRPHRGFTLIEVMTVVVIIIILSSLAASYMMFGMGKARLNNAVFDATAMINGAQLRALSRGTPHYVLIHQTGTQVRLMVLERPDYPPEPDWEHLNMALPPEQNLNFTRLNPVTSAAETLNAPIRDELVLGGSTGVDGGGLAFMDLDSTRINKPLPAPYSAISLTTPLFTPTNLDKPTQNLLAGCNFCVDSSGHPYGILRFNPDGTMDVLTNRAAAEAGAVLSFASNGSDEKDFAPKLLTVSHPAGATVVF